MYAKTMLLYSGKRVIRDPYNLGSVLKYNILTLLKEVYGHSVLQGNTAPLW